MNGMRIFLDAREDTAAVPHGEEEPWYVTSHGPPPSFVCRGARKDEEDERVPASTRRFGFAASSAISRPLLFFLLSVVRNAYTHAREDRRRDLKPPPLLELPQSCPAMATSAFLAFLRTFLVSPCTFLLPQPPSRFLADAARTTEDH
jgi:hypothetical protein